MFAFYTSDVSFMALQALCFIQIYYIKCLLYMLDTIPLLSVVSKIVLFNCTSPLVTDDFLTAMGSPLSTLCSLTCTMPVLSDSVSLL